MKELSKNSLKVSVRCFAKSVVSVLLLTSSFYDSLGRSFDSDSLSIGLQDMTEQFQSSLNDLSIELLEEYDRDPIYVPMMEVSDSIAYYRSRAQEQDEEVTRKGSFISSLNSLSLLELPVGLVRNVGPVKYTIVFSRARITPDGAMLEAYMMFEIPDTGDKIAFRGVDIPFSNSGGFSGIGRLELIGSYPVISNEHTLLTIIGKGKTFVEFDCDGFKGVGLEGKIEFSRDIIVPEGADGKIKNEGRVETTFTTYAQSWNDFLFGVTLPAFQLRGLSGFSFDVSEAYLDWSDLANPPGIVFPQQYSSAYLLGGEPNLWRGIYLSKVEIKFPASFRQRSASTRIGLSIRDMLLDDQGITGRVSVQNLISNGDMAGWPYTIDDFAVDLTANHVTNFSLKGQITVPRLLDENGKMTKFDYAAQRSADGNYIFAVTLRNSVKLPSLLASLTLHPGSSLIVKEKDDQFLPTAILNGTIGISGQNDGLNFNIPNLRFEALRISTEYPKFDIGAIALGGQEQQTISEYPIVISGIGVKKQGDDRIGINFDIAVNIGGAPEDEGFSGTGAFTIWSAQSNSSYTDEEGNSIGSADDNWQFETVELSAISIAIKKEEVFELAGSLNIFSEDEVYGDGFKGVISGKLKGIQVNAYGLFGKTSGYRYWFADALVTLKTGVPLVPGALFATAFGGGYYHKMKQSAAPINSEIGTGSSGAIYVPDENSRGLRAIMKIGTARPEAVNGDVVLMVEMNRHGGINSTTLSGNANFMSLASLAEDQIKDLLKSAAGGKITEKLSALTKGQVYGSMNLHFDNINNVFHGNLEVTVNVAGGLVRGVSSGNKAGWAVMHFEQGNWYVLIGTPDQPLGLEVANIIKTESYFMLGQNLPGSPPPPSQVTEILGDVDMDYMRDMNALQSGTGIAFGMHFLVDTGDLNFLFFYGRFAAGTGIDFMMKNYGNSTCSAATGRIGINGWFANGQAYAFVLGKIGVNVNLKFYKGRYEILSIGAAAILQAKGPNPFWMQGTVGGYYKILGGLVKGQCQFKLSIGEECTPVSAETSESILQNMGLISQVSPENGAVDVDVFNTPQVAFNIPIGQEFEISDASGETKLFRSVLDFFEVKDGSKKILGELKWNENNDVVVFDGHDILPPEKKLSANVKIGFEEKINGAWTRIAAGNESMSSEFTTSKAPSFIPDKNVLFEYPAKGQANIYPSEYHEGFIQLNDGQPYLFEISNEYKQVMRLTSAVDGTSIETDYVYQSADKKVNFNFPQKVASETIYKLEIVKVPFANSTIDANTRKAETALGYRQGGGDTLTTNVIEGQMSQRDEILIYQSYFRTSRYNTFRDKMKALSITKPLRWDLGGTAFALASFIQGTESFDAFEIGERKTHPLIRTEAVLKENKWFEKYANPTVYEGYPLFDWLTINNRQTSHFGVPPIRNIRFDYIDKSVSITEGMTSFQFSPFTYESIVYNLGESVDADFEELKLKAVNYFIDHPKSVTPRVERLIMSPSPYIRQGSYRIKLSYFVPGMDNPTSSFEWELVNELKDY